MTLDSVYGKYIRNQARDGYLPVCGNCGQPYDDGKIGDVKNYPEDGIVAVFFTCEACHEESNFTYKPVRLRK